MTSAAHPVLTSSEEPNWRTPEWLRAALHREFDLALDAAADSPSSSVAVQGPDALWLGPNSPYGIEDGLAVQWSDFLPSPRAAVFCNPPYSRALKIDIAPWIAKMADEGQRTTVVGVIPFAPQTRHWMRYVVGYDYRATEIRRFPFRVRFDPPPDYVSKAKDGKIHGANVNTAVVIWKPSSEFPKSAPWQPFERYWVPREIKGGGRYHQVVERSEDEDE